MAQIKAVIFDVDNTLFDYKEMKIHESTISAIRKLKEHGVFVIVATARSYAELSSDLLHRIHADYYVGASGMSIQDADGRVLWSERFTYAQVEFVKQLAEELDVGLTLKYEDCNYLYRHPFEMQQIYSNIGHPLCPSVFCPEMDRHETELPVGFAIRAAAHIRDRFCDRLMQRSHEYRVELFRNGMIADIYSPYVNKMTALRHLMERLGIDAQDCVSFGDGHNDLEMIRWAGTGIAMGNACAELKAAADVVCGAAWEDGIARFLNAAELL